MSELDYGNGAIMVILVAIEGVMAVATAMDIDMPLVIAALKAALKMIPMVLAAFAIDRVVVNTEIYT